jgi:hypothetical protein
MGGIAILNILFDIVCMYELYCITLTDRRTYYGQHLNHKYPQYDGYMGSGVHHNKRKKASEEMRKKLSEAHIGVGRSLESREKQSETWRQLPPEEYAKRCEIARRSALSRKSRRGAE